MQALPEDEIQSRGKFSGGLNFTVPEDVDSFTHYMGEESTQVGPYQWKFDEGGRIATLDVDDGSVIIEDEEYSDTMHESRRGSKRLLKEESNPVYQSLFDLVESTEGLLQDVRYDDLTRQQRGACDAIEENLGHMKGILQRSIEAEKPFEPADAGATGYYIGSRWVPR